MHVQREAMTANGTMLVLLVISLAISGQAQFNGTAGNDSSYEIYYRHIGCFKDTWDRALPEHIHGSFWPYGNKTSIGRCARITWSRGYKVFSVQFEGRECFSGITAYNTYAKHGIATNCMNGIGGVWANDVYAFVRICPSGFIHNGNLTQCQPCPVDHYKHNNTKCKECEGGKKTWGRKGVTTAGPCTAENPIKVSSLEVNVSPDDVKPGLIVTNFKASYQANSALMVITPLTYMITNVNKCPSQARATNITNYIDVCSQPASHSSFPFCIYHDNGRIAINKNFNCTCSEGDKFVISINVSDSGNYTIGKIFNPNGRVTINCVVCKDVRRLYEKASNACSKTNVTVQINDTKQVVVNSTNIHSINKIYVTNITGNSCSTFNVSMTHGLINPITNNVRFGNIEGRTSVEYRFENPIIVPGPAINIRLLSNNCIGLVSLTLVTVPQHPESCAGRWECLDAVFNWKNSPNAGKCGSDPDNLRIRYGHCVVKPNITRGPESKSVTSGTLVTLSCVVSSSLASSITWYRGTNEIVTNIVTMDVYNQGYYWCKASNRYGTAASGRALLVVTDYFTSLISFKAKKNKPNKSNQYPCQSCGEIANYLSSKDTPREYKHRTTCRHWEKRSNKIGVECVIYGKKKSQDEDLDSYYRNMVTILKEGAQRNNIEGLKVYWKSILVKDTGMCIKEATGKQNIQGFFTWESTKIGNSMNTECPMGPSGRSATRTCGGDFTTGAVWSTPVDDSCKYKSKKTERMNILSKIKLNSRNAKEVAKNFTKLFRSGSAKDMSEADADLAADMVDNILSVEDQLNETADKVVEVIDVIMEMSKFVLASSSSASTRFIMALERLNQKIPFEEGSTSRVINSSNVAIQAIVVSRSTFQGITFSKGNDNDDGIFVKLPRTILENSIESSIRIGFIYYANNNLFQAGPQEADGEPLLISDEVISSSVYNESVQNLTEPVRMTFPNLKDSDGNPGTPTSCVFWDVVREYSDGDESAAAGGGDVLEDKIV